MHSDRFSRIKVKGVLALVALGGLFWLLSQIGWDTVRVHLLTVGPTGFLLLCLAGLAEAGLDALPLQRATLQRVRFWPVFFLNQIGAAVNIFVPGEAGEVMKASLLSRHIPGSDATSSILIWNVAFRLSKPIAILLAACSAFLFLASEQEAMIWVLGLGLLNLGVYFTLKIILKRRWIGRLLSGVSVTSPFLNRLISHIQEAEGKTASFSHHHPDSYAAIVVLQIAARAMGFVTVCLALKLLNSSFSFPLCALVFAATELATYLVALLPTKLGTTEGASYLLFEFLKLGGSFGTIFQVILRIKQLAVVGLLLVAGLTTRLFSKPLVALSHSEETSS